LSVEVAQATVADVWVAEVSVRPAGGLGAVVSEHGAVFDVSVEAFEVLPAAFLAVTESLLAVLHERPPTVNEVVAVFPANVPLAVMLYSVAPTTAAQATEIVEAVEPVTANDAGAPGGLPSWLR